MHILVPLVCCSSQTEQSKEASDHIRRLSILHDLVSLDSQDSKDEMEDETVSLRTPSNARDMRRRHASKSVYLEMGIDPIQPGDLRRTRPLSLPPDATLDEAGIIGNGIALDNDKERVCNDLRKYGLTRTRSFNRKHRSGARVLSGSSTSIMETKDPEKRPLANVEDETDKFDVLERRLSIISDDDNTSNCIKNTLRKVSQAFSSYGSEQKLDAARAPSVSTTSLTADIDAFLAQDELWKSSTLPRTKRRSLGSIISETINPAVSSNLDRSKKRAFSTSVINEVCVGIEDDELEKRLSNLDHELENSEDYNDVERDRMAPYATSEAKQTELGGLSEIPFGSQVSGEGIEFNVPNRSEVVAGNSSNSFIYAGQEEILQAEIDRKKTGTEEALQNGIVSVDDGEGAPKRPAAPSSLNYVRSYAASIRRHRKRNVDVSESKSVYDRIREYTALVSKEKNEQKSKTVDEMLESLDTANLPVSRKYIDNRRKFMRMAAPNSSEQGKVDSVLSAPHVWFDTKPSKEAEREISNSNLDVDHNSADKILSCDKATVVVEKSSKKKDDVDALPFSGISAVLNSWRSMESNTLPRCKQGPVTGSLRPTANLKDDWKKAKSRTLDEHIIKDNNNIPTSPVKEEIIRTLECNTGTKLEHTDKEEKPVAVKDLVKKYHQQVIVPGEKEMEEMMESKLRRSKKKKEREKMKSTLQRKLSLRNLNVEEEEEKNRIKLSRSVSSENVQRGTVKQLISLFNVTKQ